jgi:hypothetical protein
MGHDDTVGGNDAFADREAMDTGGAARRPSGGKSKGIVAKKRDAEQSCRRMDRARDTLEMPPTTMAPAETSQLAAPPSAPTTASDAALEAILSATALPMDWSPVGGRIARPSCSIVQSPEVPGHARRRSLMAIAFPYRSLPGVGTGGGGGKGEAEHRAHDGDGFHGEGRRIEALPYSSCTHEVSRRPSEALDGSGAHLWCRCGGLYCKSGLALETANVCE